jgi:hypothetical protein
MDFSTISIMPKRETGCLVFKLRQGIFSLLETSSPALTEPTDSAEEPKRQWWDTDPNSISRLRKK